MKFALTLIGAAVLATGAWAGTSLLDSSQPARTVSLQSQTTGTTTGATTNDAEDISGPCDEAEHANDPRCVGSAPAAPATTTDEDEAEDRSGAEVDDRGEDNSGRGHGGDDDRGDDHGGNDDDRSGSNSGRG
jgi:hypothetical protein